MSFTVLEVGEGESEVVVACAGAEWWIYGTGGVVTCGVDRCSAGDHGTGWGHVEGGSENVATHAKIV